MKAHVQNLIAQLNDSDPSSLLKIKIDAMQTKLKGAIVWGISYE
ncbi:hypothetical protein [Pasteurella multocida]|nr:hypothetical protein [Pasteurella multocida]MEB3457157.1 hypothetical protein [Pasteurella multocida]